jgi:glyceraldehyde 3-phosphate dehydrogenase
MNIAINGFGRIGRLLFRQLIAHKDINIVAVNDLGNIDNLAYLLKYDTVYGQITQPVEVGDGLFKVAGKEVRVLNQKDPSLLPWKDLAIDVVVEATGVFDSYEKSQAHLAAGAKRVLLTAPSKDEDGEKGQTILMGVNDEGLQECSISSNGSCTTNAASPVIAILEKELGIEKAMLSTVHGYTATQNIVDGPSKHMRRGRAAAQNIIPTTTGAAIAVTRGIKELEGKFDGMAMRVPVVAGSVADITLLAKRETTVEEVNELLETASAQPQWKGILKVSHDPIVSSDIVGQPYGAIVDAEFTKVVGGNLVKVLSWYDNEWGYTSTLVQHLEKIQEVLR